MIRPQGRFFCILDQTGRASTCTPTHYETHPVDRIAVCIYPSGLSSPAIAARHLRLVATQEAPIFWCVRSIHLKLPAKGMLTRCTSAFLNLCVSGNDSRRIIGLKSLEAERKSLAYALGSPSKSLEGMPSMYRFANSSGLFSSPRGSPGETTCSTLSTIP